VGARPADANLLHMKGVELFGADRQVYPSGPARLKNCTFAEAIQVRAERPRYYNASTAVIFAFSRINPWLVASTK
jgi:hypothetical protein